MLWDLGFLQRSPTIIYEDNQSCIAIAENSTIKSKTKHIKIRYHFTREMVDAGEVQLVWCSAELVIADVLKKELDQEKSTAFVNGIMLEERDAIRAGDLKSMRLLVKFRARTRSRVIWDMLMKAWVIPMKNHPPNFISTLTTLMMWSCRLPTKNLYRNCSHATFLFVIKEYTSI